ncbi:MAG: undecaprenyl-diphosphate phosphatase [Lachnospiraceae bacterium]
MTLLQAILLGLIQGLTEFLPVSSSGHLAIAQILLGIETDTSMLFNVLLHVGTLIAVFIVFYKDIFHLLLEGISILIDIFYNFLVLIRKMFRHSSENYRRIVRNGYRKFAVLVIVSTIPTGIIGFVAADVVEAASAMLIVPGVCLIVTGILLLISDRIPEGIKTPKQVSYSSAFFIGICQGVATLPGLSRSGTTITACLFGGFQRKFAVKYSFIMSIPAILGALILELKDITLVSNSPDQILFYLAGMLTAAIVGYICVKLMLIIVRKRKFTYFAIYCFIIGSVAIIGHFFII